MGVEKSGSGANTLEAEAVRLLVALAALPDAPFPDRIMPGQVATSLGLSPARAWRLFRALFAAGYYEYEISAYSGRLTAAGRLAAQDLFK